MAREKTEPAMLVAYVLTGCDADSHLPTLRWKLNTVRMTLKMVAGKPSDSTISTQARARPCHVQQRRGPARASCSSCHTAISVDRPLHAQW